MSNPEFVRIINTKDVTVRSNRRSYSLISKNRLLHGFEGGNGIKTGFTSKAGHCFVGAAKRGDMQLISVVLASGWGSKGKEQKWTDTRILLNYGFKNFHYETIITPGDAAGRADVTRSKSSEVRYVYAEGLELPLTDEEKNSIQIKIKAPSEIQAPIEKGMTLGVADVYVGDVFCEEIPLQAIDQAARHDYKTSLEKILSGWLELGSEESSPVTLPEF